MEGRHGSCDRGLAQFEILATSILSSCLLPRTISRFRSHPSIRTFQFYQNGAYELMNFKEGITSLASTSCGDPHFQQNSLSCLEILIARDTIKLVHALENIHGSIPRISLFCGLKAANSRHLLTCRSLFVNTSRAFEG